MYLERVVLHGVEDERGGIVANGHHSERRESWSRLKQVWVVAHLERERERANNCHHTLMVLRQCVEVSNTAKYGKNFCSSWNCACVVCGYAWMFTSSTCMCMCASTRVHLCMHVRIHLRARGHWCICVRVRVQPCKHTFVCA